MKRIIFAVFLALSLLTYSCTVESSTVRSPSFSHTPNNPPPTPTQTSITIEKPEKLTGAIEGTGVFGYIQNDSSEDLAAIVLEASLYDASGNLLEVQQFAPLIEHLAPDGKSPYFTWFKDIKGAVATEVELVRSEIAPFEEIEAEFVVVSTFTTKDGELAFLGEVTNPTNKPLTLHNFAFLIHDHSGGIIDWAIPFAGPSTLAPKQAAPFLAKSQAGSRDSEWEFYFDATQSAALPPVELSFLSEPSLEITDQAFPFILGEIHNDAGYFRWVKLLIAAYYEDLLLSCTATTFPIPIGSDETVAFLESELPGLVTNAESQGIALENVTIQARIELDFSRGFDEITIPIPVEIDRYQSVGSSLLLHGQITNPEQSTMLQPTVLGAVRTTTGELVSAGWSIIAATLSPAETLDFVLAFTLPRNTDTVMSEFDIYAVGFLP